MFGFQRRLVRRCECETDIPHDGPLPQTSHTDAIENSFGKHPGRVPLAILPNR
jgi:hypothetical protein